MLVSEIILRKNNVEYKIDELKKYLLWMRSSTIKDKKSTYNTTIFRLFELLDMLRSYNALLRRHNEETKISIGENELSIADALSILDSLEQKIDIITSIIDNYSNDLDIFELMLERDKLIDERIILLKAIRISDWGTDVN